MTARNGYLKPYKAKATKGNKMANNFTFMAI